MGIGLLGFTITTEISLLIVFRVINGIGFALSGTCQISLASNYIPKIKWERGLAIWAWEWYLDLRSHPDLV